MRAPVYELVDGKARRGRLLERYDFVTPITGHHASLQDVKCNSCLLRSGGLLTVNPGFRWDFASGAIDTPPMVIASLAHDALCRLMAHGKLPWSTRKQADVYFRELLKANGCSFVRRWYAYLAVRGYSLTFAHRDRKR